MRNVVLVCALLVVLSSCCFAGGADGASPAVPGLPAVPAFAVPDRGPVPSDVPASLPGASLTMGEMTLNGQTLRDASCTGEMNLFGGNPLGTLADQSAALHACLPSGAPRVHFAFAGGIVSDVRVAGAPTNEAGWCIADVVSALQPPGAGACVATIVLGP